MKFNVTEDYSALKWNSEDHLYTGDVNYVWTPATGKSNVITVKNSSNTDIDVTVTYASAIDTMTFTSQLDLANEYSTRFDGEKEASITTAHDNLTASATAKMLRALYGDWETTGASAKFSATLNLSGSPVDAYGTNLVSTGTKVGAITFTIKQSENALYTTYDYEERAEDEL